MCVLGACYAIIGCTLLYDTGTGSNFAKQLIKHRRNYKDGSLDAGIGAAWDYAWPWTFMICVLRIVEQVEYSK
jgi:hypothetical protein